MLVVLSCARRHRRCFGLVVVIVRLRLHPCRHLVVFVLLVRRRLVVCPPRRIPRRWFSCPDLFVPSLSVSVSSCDLVFVVMSPLLFVVVPSPSSPYKLLVPPHEQVLVGVAWLWARRLGAVSW
jgi:hypothetical protein